MIKYKIKVSEAAENDLENIISYLRHNLSGDKLFFGGNVCVMPGATIGDNVVIGAGSVVNKDIPSNVVAVGNPCKVLKNI